MPDAQTDEVGGLQNTVTFLGSSVGTALSGAVLISALTTSFFTGIQGNPAIPENLSSQAQVQLASGVPFTAAFEQETHETPDAAAERAWRGYRRWTMWISALTSEGAIWGLIVILAIVASIVQARRRARRRARWDEAESVDGYRPPEWH